MKPAQRKSDNLKWPENIFNPTEIKKQKKNNISHCIVWYPYLRHRLLSQHQYQQ